MKFYTSGDFLKGGNKGQFSLILPTSFQCTVAKVHLRVDDKIWYPVLDECMRDLHSSRSLNPYSFYVTLKFTPQKKDLVSSPLDSKFIHVTNEGEQT